MRPKCATRLLAKDGRFLRWLNPRRGLKATILKISLLRFPMAILMRTDPIGDRVQLRTERIASIRGREQVIRPLRARAAQVDHDRCNLFQTMAPA